MAQELDTVLLVDDTPINQEILFDTLSGIEAQFLSANSASKALEIISETKPALILLDINMPEMDGYELCSLLKANPETADITIIFLSGMTNVNDKLKGFELGAVDYITKPFQADEVIARVKTQLTISRLERARIQTQETLENEKNVALALLQEARQKLSGPLIGNSLAIKELKTEIAAAAQLHRVVLILAIPGCGTEYVARTIHKQSTRDKQAFIYLNCSNIMAHELQFTEQGHEQGSSKLSLARGGTLFLNNIQDLPFELQDSIARNKSKFIDWDIHLICASSHNLDHMLHTRKVHVDFIKYISSFSIQLPALKDRKEDIPKLANYYLQSYASRHGKNAVKIDQESMALLQEYDWPGNIDELMNIIETQLILSKNKILRIPKRVLNRGKGIGAYHLIQKLDEGGMGEIWEVEHRLLQQPAVVKLIHSNHPNREEIQERFLREAKAISKLHSSHTIRIFDFGVQSNGSFYYAMELLHGQDLSRIVDNHGAIPFQRVLHFLKQISFSLVEAHENGIVHRDIKPSNIFISHTNFEYDNVKVLDFGIAKEIDAPDDPNLTGTRVIGTPMWMSPEAFIAEIDLTPATDIYSLACVSYWILSNKILFESKSPITYYTKHSSEIPPPIRDFANNMHAAAIPIEFENLLLRCLAKDPTKRPSSKAFLEEIIILQERHPWPYQEAKNFWQDLTMVQN